MHRSGTSAVARGLQALSVDLGESFLDAQPENPTGYWEDRGIVELNERLLKQLRLTWDATAPIGRREFSRIRVRLLRAAATRYLRAAFASKPLWGFKDPRTIRLLPFWRGALQAAGADDGYVIAIRNPRSVAVSLFRRQGMDLASAQRLWLVHSVPFLRDLRERPALVVDYDLLMRAPRPQIERIARRFSLPLDEATTREIDRFAADFLDEKLRHSVFSTDEVEGKTPEARLAHDAYALLRARAEEEPGRGETAFWEAWERIERGVERLLGAPSPR